MKYSFKSFRTVPTTRLVSRPLTFADLKRGDRFRCFMDKNIRIKENDTQYRLLHPHRLSDPIDWVIGKDNPNHHIWRLDMDEGWVRKIEDEEIVETNEPYRAKHLLPGQVFMFEEDYARLGADPRHFCRTIGQNQECVKFHRFGEGICNCDPNELVMVLEQED